MQTQPFLSIAFPSLAVAACLSASVLSGCNKPKPQPEANPANSSADAQALIQKYKSSSTNVVVTIDGVTLTQTELDAHVSRMMAANQAAGMPPGMMEGAVREVSQQVIERFIMQTVLLNEAKRQNASVSDAERAKAMEEIKASIPPGMTLEDALKSFNMTESQLQEDLANDLRIRKLIDAQATNLPSASDADVEAFYKESTKYFSTPETVKARHILLKCPEDASAQVKNETKQKAEDLRKKLVDGAEFAALAKENSDCPSREEGGELGQFGRGRMVKPFEDAAFSQKVNEVGPVVTTPFGYHIIQVSAHDEARTRPLSEVKTEIQTFLANQGKEKKVAAYVEELRSKATVTYAKDWKPQPNRGQGMGQGQGMDFPMPGAGMDVDDQGN